MKVLDHAGDSRSDPWYLAQPALRDDLGERYRERQEVFGSPLIGTRLVGALAGKREPLANFRQELRDFSSFGQRGAPFFLERQLPSLVACRCSTSDSGGLGQGGRSRPTMRGADAIAHALERVGARVVFTVSGNHVMSVFDALLETPIRLML